MNRNQADSLGPVAQPVTSPACKLAPARFIIVQAAFTVSAMLLAQLLLAGCEYIFAKAKEMIIESKIRFIKLKMRVQS